MGGKLFLAFVSKPGSVESTVCHVLRILQYAQAGIDAA